MDVGMVCQRLAPGVQDGDAADLGAQPARVRRQRPHGLGGGLEQDRVDAIARKGSQDGRDFSAAQLLPHCVVSSGPGDGVPRRRGPIVARPAGVKRPVDERREVLLLARQHQIVGSVRQLAPGDFLTPEERRQRASLTRR